MESNKNIHAIRGPKGEPRGGIVAALTIPTDAEGNVIKDVLAENMNWLKTRGIGGLMVLGSTGEFLKFTKEERCKALEIVAEINAGDFPMIANCTADTVKIVSEVANCAQKNGFNGISLMPQYFYPQSQADMLEFFLRCDESYDLPTLLYNFPERTGTRIGESVVEGFAKRGKMFALKQSGGEYEYHKALIALADKYDFSVFSGFDTRLPEVFGLGAKGCIGGLVNIVPEYMAQIFRACREGEKPDIPVEVLGERVAFVGDVVGRATFPINVAFGMEARGLNPGVPKMPVSDETMEIGKGIVADLRKAFSEWGLPLAK